MDDFEVKEQKWAHHEFMGFCTYGYLGEVMCPALAVTDVKDPADGPWDNEHIGQPMCAEHADKTYKLIVKEVYGI